MNKEIKQIYNILKISNGIDISKYNNTFLNNSLKKRINETRCGSEKDYLSFFKQNNDERLSFIDSLNINFSEFFRDSLTFSVLKDIVLPKLFVQNNNIKKKSIRIWSAACSSGQEAYSLAIILEENNNIDYNIFATDECESQIKTAQGGVYKEYEIEKTNLRLINNWFKKKKDTYIINKKLKKKIEFSVFDLLNSNLSSPPSSIFGDFDMIFCANLLFYYKPKYQKIILNKVSNSLKEGGILITGDTERDILKRNNYREIFPYSSIFRK